MQVSLSGDGGFSQAVCAASFVTGVAALSASAFSLLRATSGRKASIESRLHALTGVCSGIIGFAFLRASHTLFAAPQILQESQAGPGFKTDSRMDQRIADLVASKLSGRSGSAPTQQAADAAAFKDSQICDGLGCESL